MQQAPHMPSGIVTGSITQAWLHQNLPGALKNRYRFPGPMPDILIGNVQEVSREICTFRCSPGHADAQQD